MAPRVFISYSHDSPAHKALVLALSDRLRNSGLDANIDQYEPAPPQGWPRWMEKHIRDADFVLLVCTPTYLRRVEQREAPGKGLGVLWEANIIYNLLYPEGAVTEKFIPLLPDGGKVEDIPLPLRGHTHYRFQTEAGYEALYRRLTGQPEIVVPALGKVVPMPPRGLAFPMEKVGAQQAGSTPIARVEDRVANPLEPQFNGSSDKMPPAPKSQSLKEIGALAAAAAGLSLAGGAAPLVALGAFCISALPRLLDKRRKEGALTPEGVQQDLKALKAVVASETQFAAADRGRISQLLDEWILVTGEIREEVFTLQQLSIGTDQEITKLKDTNARNEKILASLSGRIAGLAGATEVRGTLGQDTLLILGHLDPIVVYDALTERLTLPEDLEALAFRLSPKNANFGLAALSGQNDRARLRSLVQRLHDHRELYLLLQELPKIGRSDLYLEITGLNPESPQRKGLGALEGPKVAEPTLPMRSSAEAEHDRLFQAALTSALAERLRDIARGEQEAIARAFGFKNGSELIEESLAACIVGFRVKPTMEIIHRETVLPKIGKRTIKKDSAIAIVSVVLLKIVNTPVRLKLKERITSEGDAPPRQPHNQISAKYHATYECLVRGSFLRPAVFAESDQNKQARGANNVPVGEKIEFGSEQQDGLAQAKRDIATQLRLESEPWRVPGRLQVLYEAREPAYIIVTRDFYDRRNIKALEDEYKYLVVFICEDEPGSTRTCAEDELVIMEYLHLLLSAPADLTPKANP